jgi:hypothetical protein
MDQEERLSPNTAEIKDNHTCLGSAIIPSPYAEIRDNHADWYQPFFLVHIQTCMIIPDFCIWTWKNG